MPIKSDSEVTKLAKKQRDLSKRGLGVQYDNTIACQQYYNGNDSTYQDQIQFEDTSGRKRKAMVNFPKIQQNVDAVVGFMAQNRRQAKYIARVTDEPLQQIYSRKMNALSDFHRERMNLDQLESKQDLDMCVNGYGAIETDLSYIIGNATTDPNGQIIAVKLDPMKVYWDPAARTANVMDARWIGYSEDYELTDALELFQGSSEEDFEQVADSDTDDKAGYVFNPWGGLYDKIKLNNTVEWSAKDENMVRVYNHQWFEYETFWKAPNPLYTAMTPEDALFIKARLDIIKGDLKSYQPDGINAGDMFDFDPLAEELVFDNETKAKLVKEFGKDIIKPVSFKRKCFYTAVYSGDHVFTKFKSICQQGFSIKFKTGQYNERGKYWVGMVNSMMEPQRYYNKALTELIFTIAANSKGGVMVEESAVEDISDFESKWAKTDAVIKVMDGAISGQRILQKTQGALPTGLENIITLADASIASSGVDPAFVGDSHAQETGILFKRRIRQIISKMWWVADAITLFQKEHARLMLDLQTVWVQNNEGALIPLTGKDGNQEFMQVTTNLTAPEYDVSIQEASQTPEDKAETATALGTIATGYLTVGDAATAGSIFAEAVQMMPLDGDVKSRLVETFAPKQTVPLAQFQQLQAELQKLQSIVTQSEVEKTKSETTLNMAKVQQIGADVHEKAANTVKSVEEADKVNVETQILKKTGGKPMKSEEQSEKRV